MSPPRLDIAADRGAGAVACDTIGLGRAAGRFMRRNRSSTKRYDATDVANVAASASHPCPPSSQR